MGLCLVIGSSAIHVRGSQGHQVIAGLALAQLASKARAEADRLLAQERGENLVSISIRADERKNPTSARCY